MPHVTERDPNTDLTVHTFSGEISFRECSRALDVFYAGGGSRLVLWDFTGAKLKLASEHLRALAAKMLDEGRRPEGARIAIAAASDLDFGAGHEFASYADIAGFSFPIRVFRDRDAAVRWLKETS